MRRAGACKLSNAQALLRARGASFAMNLQWLAGEFWRLLAKLQTSTFALRLQVRRSRQLRASIWPRNECLQQTTCTWYTAKHTPVMSSAKQGLYPHSMLITRWRKQNLIKSQGHPKMISALKNRYSFPEISCPLPRFCTRQMLQCEIRMT
jgi:hypothetical protein